MKFLLKAGLVLSSAMLGACATSSTSPSVVQTNSSGATSEQAAKTGSVNEEQIAAISTPAAPYPASLQEKCLGGRVTFEFSVAEDGHVFDVAITSSPRKELDPLVVETVTRQWLFKPYDAGTPKIFARRQSFMHFDPHC